MTTALTLATQKPFGSLTCDFYKNDSNEFYMTREQIGTALEYNEPRKSIQKIHERNADRLNPLSSVVNLTTVEGGREVTRDVIVYTLRGAMEICRFSRQPKADKFMDFVWNVMESLYAGRNVLATPDQQTALAPQTMQLMMDSFLKSQTTMAQYINSTSSNMTKLTETIAALANHILTMQTQPVAVSAPVETKSEAPDLGDIIADTLSGENEPAHTPKPKPVKHHGVTSTWRRNVYDTVDKIRTNQPDKYQKNNAVLYTIYEKMRTDYGFVIDQEKREYIRRHPRQTSPAVITIIEDNTTWSEIFDSILNDIYNSSIVNCVRKNDTANEPGVVVKNGLVEFKAPHPQQDSITDNSAVILDAVDRLAEAKGDKSPKHAVVYRMIFSRMSFDWNNAKEKYRAKFGVYPINKTEMVRRSDMICAKFVDTADTLIQRMENEK